MAFKVTIVACSKNAGWLPTAINNLLMKVAKEQQVPCTYVITGPDGAEAKLILEDVFEQEEGEIVQQVKYIN